MVLPEVRCMCVIALDVTRGLMSHMLWPGRSVKRGRARRRISRVRGLRKQTTHKHAALLGNLDKHACTIAAEHHGFLAKCPGACCVVSIGHYAHARTCLGAATPPSVSAIPQAPASGGRLRLQRPSVCHSCDFIPHTRPHFPCGNTLDRLAAMLWGTTMSDAYTCAHHQHPYSSYILQ